MSFRPRSGLRWAVLITVLLLMLAQLVLPAAGPGARAQETPAADPSGAAAAAAVGSVFVSAEWRFSVVAAQRAPAFETFGLAENPDRTWLIIVADVTNWSRTPSNLDVRGLRLQFFQVSDPGGFAPQSTERVAAALQTEPASVDAGIDLAADETKRITVVFHVDADFIGPVLHYGNESLPLDATLAAAGVDLQALPAVAPPPALERVLVEEVLSGGELNVIWPSANESRRVQLAGLTAPAGNDCLAAEAAAALTSRTGSAVLLEPDPNAVDSAEGDAPLARYVWTETTDGQRILLNQVMLETGFARWGASPTPTRFDTWLQAAERVARRNAAGVWGACLGPEDTTAPPQAATPEPATPTPTTAPPTATAPPDGEPTTPPDIEPTATPEPQPEPTEAAATPAATEGGYPAPIAALVAEDAPASCDRIGWSTPDDGSLGTDQLDYYAACSESGGVYISRCVESMTIGAVTAPADQVWIVCALVIYNLGDDPLFVDPFDFTLIDGTDARVQIDPTATEALPDDRLLGSGEVAPDDRLAGAIAFAVPTSSIRPFRLEIVPLVDSNAATTQSTVIIIEEYGEP